MTPQKKKKSYLPEFEYTRTDILPSTFVNGKPPKPSTKTSEERWREFEKVAELSAETRKKEMEMNAIERKLRIASRPSARPKPMTYDRKTRKMEPRQRDVTLMHEVNEEYQDVKKKIDTLRTGMELEMTSVGWRPTFDSSRKAQRKLKRLKLREEELWDEWVELLDKTYLSKKK